MRCEKKIRKFIYPLKNVGEKQGKMAKRNKNNTHKQKERE